MQTGRNVVDAAVLAQTGYVAAGYGAPFFTPDTREAAQVLKDGGTQVGWTNEGISESILDLPERGRAQRPPRAGRARTSRRWWSRATSPSAAAPACASRPPQKLLDWAKAGLPIVIVGNWSAPTVRRPRQARRERPRSRTLITQLLAQPTVRNVADRAGIPVGLAALNVQRDVEYPVQPVQTAHRVDGTTDYYFLANTHATQAASFDATFAMTDPTAVPYVADAWTRQARRRSPTTASRAAA